MEQAGERFLNVVKSTVDAWAFEEMSSRVRIVYSTLGENAVSLGAASLVMRQVFSGVRSFCFQRVVSRLPRVVCWRELLDRRLPFTVARSVSRAH